MKGKLVLIPTPIDNESPLNPKTLEQLKTAALNESWQVVVEEHKAARRRWIHWGLPREAIDQFMLYNEHSSLKDTQDLLSKLHNGTNIALMSDAGLPAFCDPGQQLVKSCHQENILVTSAPFENSVALALALSGIDHSEFYFAGFLPKEKTELQLKIKTLLTNKLTTILMDTPYRLKKTLDLLAEEAEKLKFNREVFLAMDLNKAEEKLIYTDMKRLKNLACNKQEFILVLGSSI